jgi:hypothetical protein
MLSWLKKCLDASLSDKQTEVQVALWLNAILSALLVTAAVVAVLFVVLGDGKWLLLIVVGGISSAGLLLLVRWGRVRIASVLLVFLLLGAATLSAYTASGVDAGGDCGCVGRLWWSDIETGLG